MPEVALNYQNKLEINITPQDTAPTWAQICKGFANLTQSINEVLYQASYLCDQGWSSTTVTGGQMIITLTGARIFGNQAQDYIFSDEVMFNWGKARETNLRITRGNQTILEWDVTLAQITDGGGDANNVSAITVALHGNGAPRILTGALLEQLTVVSVAGEESEETAIYINPALASGNTYVYRTGESVELPQYDAVLTTGWTTWNGTDPISDTITGHEIVIVEIDGDLKARKAGKAIVTSA